MRGVQRLALTRTPLCSAVLVLRVLTRCCSAVTPARTLGAGQRGQRGGPGRCRPRAQPCTGRAAGGGATGRRRRTTRASTTVHEAEALLQWARRRGALPRPPPT